LSFLIVSLSVNLGHTLKGQDPQLDKAVEEALKLIKK